MRNIAFTWIYIIKWNFSNRILIYSILGAMVGITQKNSVAIKWNFSNRILIYSILGAMSGITQKNSVAIKWNFSSRILIYSILGVMAGITQKNSVAAFLLWSFQKENGWVQRSENNMKNIMGISIAYWGVHL